MNIEIDKDKWSESSKRSLTFEFAKDYYENIPYICFKCGESAIFTASDQKEAYEVTKKYIDTKRSLCSKCYREFENIKKQNLAYEARWLNETESTKLSADYLQGWLTVINQFPIYGKRKNESKAAQLFKLINSGA